MKSEISKLESPCDYCPFHDKCRDLLMACQAFSDYAKSGRIFGTYLTKHLDPPLIVSGKYDVTLEAVTRVVTPSRKIYTRLFGIGAKK